MGVDKDIEKAVYWFTKSAGKGDAIAQGRLGNLYASGVGVAKDNIKAYAWLKLAVQHQNEQAEKDLAQLKAALSSQELQAGEILLQQFSKENTNTSID